MLHRLELEPLVQLLDDDGHSACTLPRLKARGHRQRLLIEPRDRGAETRRDLRRRRGEGDYITTRDVDVGFEMQRDTEWRRRGLALVTEHVDLGDTTGSTRGQRNNLVTHGHHATVDAACESTNIVRTVVVPNHPLHRHTERGFGHGWIEVMEHVEHGRPVVPRRLGRALREVDAVESRQWNRGDTRSVDRSSGRNELVGNLVEARFVVVDEVDLVDAGDHIADAEHAADREVATGLRRRAVLRIDQEDRGIGTGSGCDHVARVLHVPGCVTEQDATPIGIERAVGNIDRDALFALGAQAVGEQCEVDALAAALAARLGDGLNLVAREMAGVVEQAADQRGLAVIDRPDRDDMEHGRCDRH